jgi:hypothetical protein
MRPAENGSLLENGGPSWSENALQQVFVRRQALG